jgi:hypothetical protein
MQSSSWIALLQMLPPNQCDNLLLLTNSGLEIAILNLLRTEEEYLVIRGRMSGSDAGRVLFIPYDRITYLGFQRTVKEAEIRAMYGEPDPAAAAAANQPMEEAAVTASENAAPTPPVPAPQPQLAVAPPPSPAAAAAPTPPKSRPKLPLPDKSAMLERMRARSQAGLQKSQSQQ